MALYIKGFFYDSTNLLVLIGNDIQDWITRQNPGNWNVKSVLHTHTLKIIVTSELYMIV